MRVGSCIALAALLLVPSVLDLGPGTATSGVGTSDGYSSSDRLVSPVESAGPTSIAAEHAHADSGTFTTPSMDARATIAEQLSPANATWTDLTPTQRDRPSAREDTGLAYDSSDRVTVLFGGWGPVGLAYEMSSETWTYVNDSWTELEPTVHPSARAYALMADCPGSKGVLLWGGLSIAGSLLNDTWLFSNHSWSNLTAGVGTSPPVGAAGAAAMSYDSTIGAVVLVDSVGASTATWEFQNGIWMNVTPTLHPASSPVSALLLDDPTDGGVLLQGGRSGNETWLFANDSWSQLAPVSPLPTIGVPVGAYDAALGVPVIAGGLVAGRPGPSNETWYFSNDSWTLLATAPLPAGVIYGTATFDNADGYVLLFGGYVDQPPSHTDENESWALGAPVLSRPIVAPSPTDLGVPVTFVDPYANTSSGYAQAWTFGDGNTSDLSTAIHAYSRVGSYVVSLSASDGSGRFNNSTLTLVVLPRPAITLSTGHVPTDAGLPLAISSAVVGGAPPLRFRWDFGDGNASVFENASHAYASPGSYLVTVSVSDSAGVNATANATVVVNPAPSVTISLNWPILDIGQSLSISAMHRGGTGAVRFTYAGAPLGCLPGNVTTYTCNPASVGTYLVSVTAIDALGAVARASAPLLTVYPSLTATVTADRRAIDIGQEVNISTSVSGGAPGPYTVSLSGLPPGCAPPVDSTSWRCLPSAVGSYNLSVVVNDTSASPWTSAPFVLTVNPNPILLFSASPPDPSVVGTVLTFYANVSGGTPPFAYAYEGLPIGCLPGIESALPCVTTVAGPYNVKVTVTDAAGVERSRNLTVGVLPATTGTPSGQPPWPVLIVTAAVASGLIGAAAFLSLRRRRGRRRSIHTASSTER